MINFSLMIGAKVLLEKPPYPGIFEAEIMGVSANEQFVKLSLSNGELVWEEIDQLKLIDHLE